MQASKSRYLAKETFISFLCNGILNYAAAYLIFHAHRQVPIQGYGGVVQDLIGETLIATFLSYVVPAHATRKLRRAGTLSFAITSKPIRARNLYLQAFIAAIIFTCLLMPLNAWLIPRKYPTSVSLTCELWLKCIYGAVIGCIASLLAVSRTLREND